MTVSNLQVGQSDKGLILSLNRLASHHLTEDNTMIKLTPEEKKIASTNYNRWLHHIFESDTEMPDSGEWRLDAKGEPRQVEYKRSDVLLVAINIAKHGTLGLDCYPGLTQIAKETGLTRKTVGRCRTAAIQLGWLRPNGRHHHQVEALDIDIPTLVPESPVVAAKPQVAIPAPKRTAPVAQKASSAVRYDNDDFYNINGQEGFRLLNGDFVYAPNSKVV